MAGRWQDDPAKVRVLVAVAGLAVLLVLSGVLWVRRVDPVEVAATLLFVPLFLALVRWHLVGGVLAALAASGIYVALRWPAIESVGWDSTAGLVLGRSVGYLAFGVLGGFAVARLQRSLSKLDLYDQVDDDTGLFNARFLVDGIELERRRAERYQTLFSVIVLDLPAAPVAELSGRARRRALRQLGDQVQASIRAVDRAAFLRAGERLELVLLLPETPTQGAAVLAGRFRRAVAGLLAEQGVAVSEDDLEVRSYTVPGEDEPVAALRARVAKLIP
ncbi:MAG: GGDEF domain-containing protein [Nitriliruptoraceae bacterium]